MCSVLRLLPTSGAIVSPDSSTDTRRPRADRNSASSSATRSAPTMATRRPSGSRPCADGGRPAVHKRLLGAGDSRHYHSATVGHHHGVGPQRHDVVGRDFCRFDPDGAAGDLVAEPLQERFVRGMQDRRRQQSTSGLTVPLEERDVMPPLGGHPGGLHAGGAAADHHDPLRVRRGMHGQFSFPSRPRVDSAVHRKALFHCVDAVFAGDAPADAVGAPRGRLVRQLGVGQHGPAHRDEIGAAVGQDLSACAGSWMRPTAITGTSTTA